MKKRIKTYGLLSFISIALLANSSIGQKRLLLSQLDSPLVISNHSFLIDSSGKWSFQDVKHKPFRNYTRIRPKAGATYWFKFQIQPEISSDYLRIDFSFCDYLDVYIPTFQGYQWEQLGFFHANTRKEADNSILTLETDQINFDQPFYYSKSIISYTGTRNLDSPLTIRLTNSKDLNIAMIDKSSHRNSVSLFWVGMLIITLLIFLINYFVSRNSNILLYSAYLLCITLFFVNQSSFLGAFYSRVNPIIYLYIDQFTSLYSRLLYFIFTIYFVRLKEFRPSLYYFAIWFMLFYTVYGAAIYILTILDPQKTIYVSLFFYLKNFSSLLSFSIFTYLLFQRLDLPKQIVLLCGILLIVASTIIYLIDRPDLLLPIVVVETLLFNWVINYENIILKNRSPTAAKTRFVAQPNFNVENSNISLSFEEKTFIKDFKSIVEQNLNNSSLSIAHVSKELGLSRVQLYRKSMSALGCSPSNYIRIQRMEAAAKLLKERKSNISDVAYSVGFSSLSYFTKCFREIFGQTPSAFINSSEKSTLS